jgi:hypothetical protein
MNMMPNAALLNTQVQVHDHELSLYARMELNGNPSMLMGRHEVDRTRMRRHGRRTGSVRRAGRWLSHGIWILLG